MKYFPVAAGYLGVAALVVLVSVVAAQVVRLSFLINAYLVYRANAYLNRL